jgi:cyclopropane-fatty-acyl-phospholipid synthase
METTTVTSKSLALKPVTRLRFKERLFVRALRGLRGGSLRIIFPSGSWMLVGDNSDPLLDLVIVDDAFFAKVISGGSVGFGEAYVAGLWDTSNLTGLLTLMAKNQNDLGRMRQGFSLLTKKLNQLYHRARRNTIEQSRRNIQEHYDLSNDFYATFLDATMTYSSALFKSSDDSLEQAQWNKIDRMLDLADVKEGDSILEIGSGWGALAERAALRGCKVKTITLSEEQFIYAQQRFTESHVADSVEILMQDYRHLKGEYDAVISCEMIEAVGHEFLESYFAIIRQSLKRGAKAVIQAITIPDERYKKYCRSCDWIQKYIFPGGHLPSPEVIRSNVEAADDMRVLEMNSFGHDYAETLKRWQIAFNQNISKVSALGFDAEFCRKWNYYLSYSEAGFSADLIDVKHVVAQRQ